MLKNRCIIPADGWYAWKKVGKKTMVPHRFTVTDPEIFSFAGVWEEFEDESGSMVHTFMIITTQPNELVAGIADHMPVVLNKTMEDSWLQGNLSEADLIHLLIPYPAAKMSVYTVSPRINDPSIEHPSLILPAPSADQHGNLTLFD